MRFQVARQLELSGESRSATQAGAPARSARPGDLRLQVTEFNVQVTVALRLAMNRHGGTGIYAAEAGRVELEFKVHGSCRVHSGGPGRTGTGSTVTKVLPV